MATSGQGTGMVGYNVQSAIDRTHHLTVGHEVITIDSDRGQLANMAQQVREAAGIEKLAVVADRRYFSGYEVFYCDHAGIATYVPKPPHRALRQRAASESKISFTCWTGTKTAARPGMQ